MILDQPVIPDRLVLPLLLLALRVRQVIPVLLVTLVQPVLLEHRAYKETQVQLGPLVIPDQLALKALRDQRVPLATQGQQATPDQRDRQVFRAILDQLDRQATQDRPVTQVRPEQPALHLP